MRRGESKVVNRANRSNGTSDRQGSKIQLRWETATIFAGLDLKRACTFRNMRNSLSRSLALSLLSPLRSALLTRTIRIEFDERPFKKKCLSRAAPRRRAI